MRARHIFVVAVVALASVGVCSCKYDDGPKPGDKTSVGRVTWPFAWASVGAIGGGPPASNAPNPVDDPDKDFLGRPRENPLASPPAPPTSPSTKPITRPHEPRRGR
jgi:hypothetical protein